MLPLGANGAPTDPPVLSRAYFRVFVGSSHQSQSSRKYQLCPCQGIWSLYHCRLSFKKESFSSVYGTFFSCSIKKELILLRLCSQSGQLSSIFPFCYLFMETLPPAKNDLLQLGF